MSPKVAVIILNYNGIKDTAECLESVKKIEYPDFETVVVDNGSSDGSVELIRKHFPRVVLIENRKNLGFAQGNNVGIAYALKSGAEFVFLLNNDTVVDPAIIERFIDAARRHPEAGIFSAKIYYYSDPDRIWFAGGLWDHNKLAFSHKGFNEMDEGDKYRAFEETDYGCGCALFFRKEVVERIGLLEKRFFLLYEETDWCYRAKRKGFRSFFVPEAKVWHKVSVTFGGNSSPLYMYFYTRNRLLWASRNLPRPERLAVYKRVAGDFFPSLSDEGLRAGFLKKLYWDLNSIIKGYAATDYKARLFGALDFILGRFGDCPHRKTLEMKGGNKAKAGNV